MKGLLRSLARGAEKRQPIRTVAVPVRAVALATTDLGATGAYGSVVINGLPQGNLLFLGAVCYMRFTKVDANIIDTFSGTYAVGTVPAAADGTLSGTEANITDVAPVAAAVAGVSALTRAASTDALGGGVIDNTAGDLELNLNLVLPDASSAANSSVTVDGVLHLALIVLGDD